MFQSQVSPCRSAAHPAPGIALFAVLLLLTVAPAIGIQTDCQFITAEPNETVSIFIWDVNTLQEVDIFRNCQNVTDCLDTDCGLCESSILLDDSSTALEIRWLVYNSTNNIYIQSINGTEVYCDMNVSEVTSNTSDYYIIDLEGNCYKDSCLQYENSSSCLSIPLCGWCDNWCTHGDEGNSSVLVCKDWTYSNASLVTAGTTGSTGSTSHSGNITSTTTVSNSLADSSSLIHNTFLWTTVGVGAFACCLLYIACACCWFCRVRLRAAHQHSHQQTLKRYEEEAYDLDVPARTKHNPWAGPIPTRIRAPPIPSEEETPITQTQSTTQHKTETKTPETPKSSRKHHKKSSSTAPTPRETSNKQEKKEKKGKQESPLPSARTTPRHKLPPLPVPSLTSNTTEPKQHTQEQINTHMEVHSHTVEEKPHPVTTEEKEEREEITNEKETKEVTSTPIEEQEQEQLSETEQVSAREQPTEDTKQGENEEGASKIEDFDDDT